MIPSMLYYVAFAFIGFCLGYYARGTGYSEGGYVSRNREEVITSLYGGFLGYLDTRYRRAINPPINNFNWRCGILQAMIGEDHPAWEKHQYYSQADMKMFCDDLRDYAERASKLHRVANAEKLLETWFIEHASRSEQHIPVLDKKFTLQY